MRTLEQCIEDADKLAQQVLDHSYEYKPVDEEFKTLLEARSRYVSVRDGADTFRVDLTRKVFAAAYKKFIDQGGHISYVVIKLFKEMDGARFDRTISVEDRDDTELKFQVNVADVRRNVGIGLPEDGAPATFVSYFRPWPAQTFFHSLTEATSHAENVRAESRLDGFEPVQNGQNRP
jgi:hypothetical protein